MIGFKSTDKNKSDRVVYSMRVVGKLDVGES